MNFEEIRESIFERIQQTNTCRKLAPHERLTFKEFEAVWEVETELPLSEGKVEIINMYLCFPFEFPMVLPSVYISKSTYERFGYLPHINAKGSICIYETETTVVNYKEPEAPYRIVKQCLLEAKRLIERELQKQVRADYQTEIIAYWENSYHKKDEIINVFSQLPPSSGLGAELFCFHLKEIFGGSEIILHAGGEEENTWRDFLRIRNHNFEEHSVYYFGDIPELKPPFYWRNQSVFTLIKQSFPQQLNHYKRFLNNAKLLIAVFSMIVNGQRLFFGWIHRKPQSRRGYRDIYRTADALSGYAQGEPVIRLRFESLAQDRLSMRTDGYVNQPLFNLAVTGLGSIGSNLIGLLSSLPVKEFRLIDKETLKVENINRHLLGLSYVGWAKSHAMQDYLRQKAPLRPVSVRLESIVKVLSQEPSFFQRLDAMFVAIGTTSIEDYIISNTQSDKLNLPLFIIWIEPFAIGGHMIYIPPNQKIDYLSFFPDNLYKYNAVAAMEYQKDENRLLLKEAGCQSTYLPYSQESVHFFLNRIFPEICQLLKQPVNKALAFTWLGNANSAQYHDLELSEFAHKHKEEGFIIIEL